jgi:serine phosphatase RsbU (regulator of sigma subunit)/CHASE2 domain-containing sensor protein
MRSVFFKRYAIYILFIFLFGVFAAASYLHLFENYELTSLDMRFLLRPPGVPVSDRIAIIEIGEDTLKKLGRFPFDRSYHAIAVKALSEFGAKAVIFDLLFSEPHADDGEFALAMKEARIIYLPYAFDLSKNAKGNLTEADGYLAAVTADLADSVKATGHINLIPDIDGKFRRVPLFIKYENELYPYLSMKTVWDYLGVSDKEIGFSPGSHISLGKSIRIPLDDESNMIVNFSGKWGAAYAHYSFVDILQSYAAVISGDKPVLDPAKLKGRICIIGLTASGTSDIHPNPFEALYPGVGIHAEVINSILNKRFIARASREANILILILIGAVTAFLTMKTKPVTGLAALSLVLIVFAVISALVFNFYGCWIDAACPAVAAIAVYLFCTLYKYVGEWRKRLVLENELDIARKIQESFLPKALPETPGIEVSARMLTAKQVGGDLYDFIEFPDGRLGVMIGDVSGKGVPASLFMAMVSGAFKFFALTDTRPDDALAGLNSKLARESSSGLFVTMFYAILNLKNKTILYANGGHLPALFLRDQDEPVFLDTTEGAPLGLMEGAYSSGKIDIRAGDVIVFYTDGVTEAMNRDKEMYEKERLSSVVRRNAHLTPEKILSAIEKDVRRFEPKDDQHDDITIITVKIL